MDSGTATTHAMRSHPVMRLLLAETPRLRLARFFLIALASVLIIIFTLFLLQRLWYKDVAWKDFPQEYLLARALLSDGNPYLDLGLYPAASQTLPTPHPPTVGVVFFPFAFLDMETSALAWLIVQVLCLLASVHLLGRVIGRPSHPAITVLISAALMAWHPIFWDLQLGQVNVIQLLLLVGAWGAYRHDRHVAVGVFLGLIMLVKPTLWPLALLLLFRREREALMSLCAVVVVGYALTFWRLGLDAHILYLTQVLPQNIALWRGYAPNTAAVTIGWRLFHGTGSALVPAFASAPPLIGSQVAAQISLLAIPAILFAVGAVLLWKHRKSDAAIGMAVCLSLLVSPIVWASYLMFLIVPWLQTAQRLSTRGFPKNRTKLFLLVSVLLLIPYLGPSTGTSVSAWVSLATALHPVIAIAGLMGLLAFMPSSANASHVRRATPVQAGKNPCGCWPLRLREYLRAPPPQGRGSGALLPVSAVSGILAAITLAFIDKPRRQEMRQCT